MAVTKQNWPLASYTDNTWETLVTGPATVVSVLFCNVSSSDTVVEMRVEDGAGTKLSTVLPASVLSPKESYSLDMVSLNVLAGQRLQIRANSGGAEFFASGVI